MMDKATTLWLQAITNYLHLTLFPTVSESVSHSLGFRPLQKLGEISFPTTMKSGILEHIASAVNKWLYALWYEAK